MFKLIIVLKNHADRYVQFFFYDKVEFLSIIFIKLYGIRLKMHTARRVQLSKPLNAKRPVPFPQRNNRNKNSVESIRLITGERRRVALGEYVFININFVKIHK